MQENSLNEFHVYDVKFVTIIEETTVKKEYWWYKKSNSKILEHKCLYATIVYIIFLQFEGSLGSNSCLLPNSFLFLGKIPRLLENILFSVIWNVALTLFLSSFMLKDAFYFQGEYIKNKTSYNIDNENTLGYRCWETTHF